MSNLHQTNPAQINMNKSVPEYSIRESVHRSLNNYFAQLGDQQPSDLYGMVIAEVEGPLFEGVMAHTKGNQSKAAIILGISRGTLRKKLKIYNID